MNPTARETPAPGRGWTLATLLLLFLAALPALVLRYLPMTDLPQHLAISAILRHLHDPAFGFAEYYRLNLDHTLYLLPYGLHLLLAEVLSPEPAMRAVVFLSVLAYPLAALAAFRAMRKPAWLALLTVPLLYHRAFFWGFLHFDLAAGMALGACAILMHPRPGPGRHALLALLGAALAVTHVYGLAILFGYLGLWFLASGGRLPWSRLWPLFPAVLGALAWFWMGRGVEGFGGILWPGPAIRVREAAHSVLGGYRDSSETVILVAWALLVLAVLGRSLPFTWSRWRRLGVHERTIALMVAANVVLYFVLPEHTRTAKFIHFRHAVLAALWLPLLLPGRSRLPSGVAHAAALLAVVAAANSWVHLVRFDREARPFDRIVAALPERPRVMQIDWDPDGNVMQTRPYAHFAGYIQARRGGWFSSSFPRVFWNVPVRMRDDAPVPSAQPLDMEWHPEKYDLEAFGRFYDFVLECGKTREGAHPVPYEPILEAPPWTLGKTPGR